MKELSTNPHAVYCRKWYATRPEAQRKYNRKWRDLNPDKVLELSQKHNRRASLKRANVRVIKKLEAARRAAHNKPDKLEGEILRHHAKGRSVATIVVWMNIPASVVTAAIENSKATK